VDHLGSLRVVLFEPNDLLLIHGSPDRRRRYLDLILIQTISGYAKTLSQYRRVLSQRNRLLSEWNGATSELFAWNIRLTELATVIHDARSQLIDHLNELASNCYAQIAGSGEPLALTYQSAAAGDFAAGFLQLLEAGLNRDIAAGFTTIGPHRDDFSIQFKNSDIMAVASRGEMRTVVLALKMAELAYIERYTETRPMLLLDDVFSELDDSRRRFLLGTLGGYQSLVTTTNADVSAELSANHTTVLTDALGGDKATDSQVRNTAEKVTGQSAKKVTRS
jgi:DNA replication and repair protein RecF